MCFSIASLEWEARGKFIEFSPTAFGEYTVEFYEESDGCGWECVYDGTGTIGYFPTEAEAKAAAQADYEQRIRSALTHPAPPLAVTDELPQDVIDLVIAARIVAFEDQSPEALKALDTASEAFASRAGWDDEPEDVTAALEAKQ